MEQIQSQYTQTNTIKDALSVTNIKIKNTFMRKYSKENSKFQERLGFKSNLNVRMLSDVFNI